MRGGSKLDEIIFNEFANDKELLHRLANEIRKISNDQLLKEKLYQIEEDEQTANDSVMEGQVIYKLHKLRERDSDIVKYKKRHALSLFGHLECEVCVFNFHKVYGYIECGYIECHHRTPLSKFEVESKTTLDDLALVCANCHRMLHRGIDTLAIEDLKRIIYYNS